MTYHPCNQCHHSDELAKQKLAVASIENSHKILPVWLVVHLHITVPLSIRSSIRHPARCISSTKGCRLLLTEDHNSRQPRTAPLPAVRQIKHPRFRTIHGWKKHMQGRQSTIRCHASARAGESSTGNLLRKLSRGKINLVGRTHFQPFQQDLPEDNHRGSNRAADDGSPGLNNSATSRYRDQAWGHQYHAHEVAI